MATEQFTWNQWDYFKKDLALVSLIKNHDKTYATFGDSNVDVEANASGIKFTIGSKVLQFDWDFKYKIEILASIVEQMRSNGIEEADFTDADRGISAIYNASGIQVTIT